MSMVELHRAALGIFFVFLLYIGPGNVLNHELSHQFPYGYFASDAFQHQTRAEAIKDMGNFRYEANYISKGLENIVGRYPPLLYHLAVSFSHVSGLQVYDSIYFLVLLLIVLSAVIMYLIIENFNRNIALISLPLSALAFTFPLSIGFSYGHWPSLAAQFFLIAFFWAVGNIELEKSFFIIMVLFASILMTHTSEAAFAVVFLALFLASRLVSRKMSKKDIKILASAVIGAAVISSYYLFIFYHTFGVSQAYKFTVEPKWDGNPGFYIKDFGVLLIPIIAGLFFALFSFKGMHTALIVGISMLIGGFMNYVGFTFRSFQIRFLWPVYLCALFGLGIYSVLKLASKKWLAYSSILFFILAVVFVGGLVKSPWVFHYEKMTNSGVMNPYHWDALKWISQKTEQNADIYFFYGDIYSQDALLRNSKRVHSQVDPEDIVNAISNKEIRREYMTETPGDAGGGLNAWTGTLKLEYAGGNLTFYEPEDICRFDYFVFDKISRQPVLAQYNLLVAGKIAEKGASRVFENEVVVILKNKNTGGDCIEEGKF